MLCTCVIPSYAGSIKRRILVQASQNINIRTYLKKSKQKRLGAWLKW
jgi:hypothetical protein